MSRGRFDPTVKCKKFSWHTSNTRAVCMFRTVDFYSLKISIIFLQNLFSWQGFQLKPVSKPEH